ncbi:MAG TPA: PIG-L family deacetylase [Ilumatobacteraceae bacterium]|nr:PIG-L family deacetylase [Ilumatobacteraceae bacterium]
MSIVFFHAHPDDESIFTGGTIARLSAAGHRCVIVIATSGELGTPAGGHEAGDDAADEGWELATIRRREAHRAAERLGAARIDFLGYSDSGLTAMGEPPVGAFAVANVAEAASRLAQILVEEAASELVIYDDGGIYGHPDHLAVHRVGLAAAAMSSTETVYEATVDREYLHFVETHLVGHALDALGEPAPMGVPTVLLSATVDVRAVIDAKREAMAAHVSQLPPHAPVLTMDRETFAAVYGFEWFVRHGPAGLIDTLGF